MMMMTTTMATVQISKGDQQFDKPKPTEDTEADPLLPPSSPCFLDSSVEVVDSFPYIIVDYYALLFYISDGRILLDDQSFQVLEELGEFHHLLFDLLDILMSSPDVLRDPLCIASSIALDKLRRNEYGRKTTILDTYRLAENLLI